MKKRIIFTFLMITLLSMNHLSAQTDTIGVSGKYTMDEVVVTGTRNETDIRHLPMTISVVNREEIEKRYDPSLLPSLSEQVPGLFITSRGVLGYGVSDGAAGGMSLRGIGGGSAARMLVLIDGHPQYMGLFGHPISDAYQSMLAEKVEVVPGTGFCSVWFECYGWGDQHRNPQATRGRHKDRSTCRVWII